MTSPQSVAVALDLPTAREALALARPLAAAGVCGWFKVGLELFCACGPALIGELRALGPKVFLDLKLHDIPETVGRAARAAAAQGADLLTVHASGGAEMVRRAAQAVREEGRTRLVAITVLTSLGPEDLDLEASDTAGLEALVLRRARRALAAGAHGVVTSPREVAMLRALLGPEALLVTPGIRPARGERAGSPAQPAHDDQRRVATARQALSGGADVLVVGRPVRDAADPVAAARALWEEP